MSSLGERIKILRGNHTQREFARKLGIPPTTLGNYENNKSELKFTTIDLFVTNFKVNIEWLLFGRGPMYKNQEQAAPMAEPVQIEKPPVAGTSGDENNNERKILFDLPKEKWGEILLLPSSPEPATEPPVRTPAEPCKACEEWAKRYNKLEVRYDALEKKYDALDKRYIQLEEKRESLLDDNLELSQSLHIFKSEYYELKIKLARRGVSDEEDQTPATVQYQHFIPPTLIPQSPKG